MPENPLLPNKNLQRLYTAMLRARDGAATRATGLEAILAAATQMLEPGDAIVSSNHGNALAELLLPARRGAASARSLAAAASPLAFAAGAAANAQVAGSSRLVAVLLDSGELESSWVAVLQQAHDDRLPLIVICLDPSAARQKPSGPKPTLTWQVLTPVLARLRLPLLTVDGADAVAMYRATQESVLRARHADGPAVLWCILPPAGARKPRHAASAPVARLEGYLAARRIPLPRTTPKPVGKR